MRGKLGVRINIHTLLYIKQISNQDLWYGTENYTQYSIITYMEKESEKEWTYMCMYMCVCVCVCESLCCTLETNTTLLVNQQCK